MQRSQRQERFSELVAFLAPLLLLLSLGLADGGFGLEARHVAGIASWVVVIALLATGTASNVAIGRPAYWSFGLIGALAAFTLASSLWSDSVERSFAEGGRSLAYLGFFVAALLITRTARLRQRFAEGLTVSIAVLSLLGLAGRILPELLTVTDANAEGSRLRFPLGYWNANAVVFGIGIAMYLWMRGQGSNAALRWLAVGVIPATLLAIFFAFSRGGTLATLIAVGVLIALSEHRLRHATVVVLALITTAPAILLARASDDLADGVTGSNVASEGFLVFLVLLAGTAVFVGALLLLQRGVRGRFRAAAARATATSRDPRFLKVAGSAIAVLGIAAVGFVGSQAVDSFSEFDPKFPDDPTEHFGNFSGAGRHDFWRVALVGFTENPVLGSGAGTYAFTWRQERSLDVAVQDAHSVYLEPFSELGAPGGLLTVGMFIVLLWIGFAAWNRSLRGDRERLAVMLAAIATFAVVAGFDWFWELAAVAAIFFVCAGVLVGARCAQISNARGVAPEEDHPAARYGLALGGIVVGWISIAVLVGPLLMHIELDNSQKAAAQGDYDSAVEHALTARSLQPWAASPYVQLGGLAELQNEPDIAFDHYDEAKKRESANWQIWQLGAGAAEDAGEEDTARVWHEQARELNPLAEEPETDQ